MDTIYNLQSRADELRKKTETESISAEMVGALHADTLDYVVDLERNLDGLGIRKIYKTYAAMTAEGEAPTGTNGKALRYGQLVTVYDGANTAQAESGNIYAWQTGQGASAWLLVGNLGNIADYDALIAAEETARQEADAALQAAVDAAEAAVTAEAEARDAADKALASTVDATCQAIVADVEALQAAVTTETQGRKSADTSLDSRLTAVEAQVKTNTENIDSDLAQVQARIGDVERQVGEVVKTVELTQLDNMVLSREDAYAMTKETAHSVWTVTNDGRKVGVLQVFADGSSHQLTQVLTSNYTASDDWSEHWDGEVRTYYRMYNIQSPSLENAKGTWSSWTELVPKTCRTYIETLKSFMEETPKQVALTQDEYDAMAAAGTLKDGTYYNILEE